MQEESTGMAKEKGEQEGPGSLLGARAWRVPQRKTVWPGQGRKGRAGRAGREGKARPWSDCEEQGNQEESLVLS